MALWGGIAGGTAVVLILASGRAEGALRTTHAVDALFSRTDPDIGCKSASGQSGALATRKELHAPSAAFAPMLARAQGRANVVDVRTDPRWTAAPYQDDIHSKASGARVLARIIAKSATARRADAPRGT